MGNRPRLVVLDGHTLNPGDLDWGPLEALADTTIHDRTPPAETVARAAAAELVLTNKTVLNDAVIGALPRLRYIGVLATGYNVVDTAAARARRIPVCNVPGYATAAVTQHVFALVLHIALRVDDHASSVRTGDWSRSPDFAYTRQPLLELAGLTFGVVGFGAIGQAVARVASALGMRVLACGRPGGRPGPLPGAPAVEWCADTDSLLAAADVISLHCPLTPDTRHLIDARALARMKPQAMLINTGRGDLVDEIALAEALRAGRLRGVGLDVLSREPPPADHPLIEAPRCWITPHIGWATVEARRRLLAETAANVAAFLRGEPRHVVNPD